MKSSNLHLKGVPGTPHPPAALPVKLKAFVFRGYDQALCWDATQLLAQGCLAWRSCGADWEPGGGGAPATLRSPVMRVVEDRLPLPLAWEREKVLCLSASLSSSGSFNGL